LINELSLTPFNKANCFAMLNTLYPPTMTSNVPFVQPTHQLTATVLASQRKGFFRYITAVEKNGVGVLKRLVNQGLRPGEESGWPSVRDTMDKYLRMAGSIIDECLEITAKHNLQSSIASSAGKAEIDEEKRRKVDSGISFSSSSNRTSTHSHSTRPSTSSSISVTNNIINNSSSSSSNINKNINNNINTSNSKHDDSVRRGSQDKVFCDAPVPEVVHKPVGSTLERIAREIRKIRSRSDIRDLARLRPAEPSPKRGSGHDAAAAKVPGPGTEKKVRQRPSLLRVRPNNALKERSLNSAATSPVSRDGVETSGEDSPVFDVDEMKRRRMVWEAQQKRKDSQDQASGMELD
jgi:hypothetical protein